MLFFNGRIWFLTDYLSVYMHLSAGPLSWGPYKCFPFCWSPTSNFVGCCIFNCQQLPIQCSNAHRLLAFLFWLLGAHINPGRSKIDETWCESLLSLFAFFSLLQSHRTCSPHCRWIELWLSKTRLPAAYTQHVGPNSVVFWKRLHKPLIPRGYFHIK